MSNHIYTVEIFYKDGSTETRKNLNIMNNYNLSCREAERTLEFSTKAASVSVKNELGVTVFFKERATALCEVEGYKVIADEIAEFFHKVPM